MKHQSPLRFVRRLRRTLLPALLMFIATEASAYTTGIVEWLNFPLLSVESDGHEYTGTVAIAHGWEGRVAIESSGLPRVKSWSLYPVLKVEGLDSLSFSLYKAGKSYPWGNRPQNVHRTVGDTFPGSFTSDYAAEACNLNLQLLMDQGYPRATVLSENRTIAARVSGYLDIDITVGDPIIEAFSRDIEIECVKSVAPPSPPSGPGNIQALDEFALESAALTIYPSTYSGPCPTDLSLFMTVKGNLKGTFEARIESTAGWKSTKFVHQTNEFQGGTGLWIRDFTEPFTVPVVMPPSGNSGGGGIPSGPGDFAVLPPPGDDVFPPQGAGSHAVGGITGHDPGSNVHQQSLRLVAKANGKTVFSGWKLYRVTCDPKVGVDVGGTDFQPRSGGGGDPPGPGPSGGDPRPKPKEPGKPGSPGPGADKPSPSSPGPQSSATSAQASRRQKAEKKKARARAAKPTAKQEAKSERKARRKQEPEAKATATKATAAKAAAARTKAPASKPKTTTGGPRRAPDAKPDLTVVRARPSAKKARTIEFLVKNGGQASSTKAVSELTCVRNGGGAETWRVSIPALAAGARRWVETKPVRARQVRTRVRGCRIALDPDNAVAESDESNNVFPCPDCAGGAGSRR